MYLAHQYKKMLYQLWSYRITIDENQIPLKRICVLNYLCLLLTKVETSFKSYQYNTKGRHLSNYSNQIDIVFTLSLNVRGCVKIKSTDLTNMQREVTFAPHIWPEGNGKRILDKLQTVRRLKFWIIEHLKVNIPPSN